MSTKATEKLAAAVAGLAAIDEGVKEFRQKLQETLSRGEQVSSSDEAWLDLAANLIVEERLCERLREAVDLEKEFDALSPDDLLVLDRLLEACPPREIVKTGTSMKKKKRRHHGESLFLDHSLLSSQ